MGQGIKEGGGVGHVHGVATETVHLGDDHRDIPPLGDGLPASLDEAAAAVTFGEGEAAAGVGVGENLVRLAAGVVFGGARDGFALGLNGEVLAAGGDADVSISDCAYYVTAGMATFCRRDTVCDAADFGEKGYRVHGKYDWHTLSIKNHPGKFVVLVLSTGLKKNYLEKGLAKPFGCRHKRIKIFE